MEEQFSEGKARETDRTGTGSTGMDTSQGWGFGSVRRKGFGLEGKTVRRVTAWMASRVSTLHTVPLRWNTPEGLRPDQTGGASARPAASEVDPSEATEDLRVVRSSE